MSTLAEKPTQETDLTIPGIVVAGVGLGLLLFQGQIAIWWLGGQAKAFETFLLRDMGAAARIANTVQLLGLSALVIGAVMVVLAIRRRGSSLEEPSSTVSRSA